MIKNKIALEEHFMHPDFIDYWKATSVNISPNLFGKALDALQDFGDRRLNEMDNNNIDIAILSLSGPGVQIEKSTNKAIDMAKRCNDFLADKIVHNPNRYAGFAHLAFQDPKSLIHELERCIKDLNFKGVMINGSSNGTYLDDDRYDGFWECLSDLGVPLYIHPNNPPEKPFMYHNHPELWGPVWSWTVETGNHALRILFSGVFDRHPNAKLILGHMGETLPYQLWRFDSRWKISNKGDMKLNLSPSSYFKNNFWCTTAGVCSDAPLICALNELGNDKVMFSVDYPFEITNHACEWIDNSSIPHSVKQKVCRDNAANLFKL